MGHRLDPFSVRCCFETDMAPGSPGRVKRYIFPGRGGGCGFFRRVGEKMGGEGGRGARISALERWIKTTFVTRVKTNGTCISEHNGKSRWSFACPGLVTTKARTKKLITKRNDVCKLRWVFRHDPWAARTHGSVTTWRRYCTGSTGSSWIIVHTSAKPSATSSTDSCTRRKDTTGLVSFIYLFICWMMTKSLWPAINHCPIPSIFFCLFWLTISHALLSFVFC